MQISCSAILLGHLIQRNNFSLLFVHLKLEKQLSSITQVAIIVHNDFYYLSQEVLGLAFQVHSLFIIFKFSIFLGQNLAEVIPR